MKIAFLSKEKDEVVDVIGENNIVDCEFIDINLIKAYKCDMLFIKNKNNFNDNSHNIFETEGINYIVIGDSKLFSEIYNNYNSITDIKFDECYKNKSIYRFFRIGNKKLYTIVKYFKNFYYIDDPYGDLIAIDGHRVSKCYDYFNNAVKTYERDINTFLRYAIEKSKKHKIFLGRNYRILYFDIETNSCVTAENPIGEILSIVSQDSLTGEVKKWAIYQNKENLIEQEKKMLEEFCLYAKNFDVITGWNVLRFDIPYLINRCYKLSINPSLMSMTNSPVSCKYKPEDRVNPWFIKVIGLNLYDMMSASARALAYLPEKLKDNKLDTVAEKILGEKKIHTDTPAVLFRNNKIDELLEYNVQDTLLLMKLDQKIGISDLLISTLEFVPGLNLENSNYNSRIIDFYLLSKFDIIYPSVIRTNITDIEGAIVMDPVSGIHNNVAVMDVSGMYPSLVRTFNISPETIISSLEEDCVKIDTHKCGTIYYTTKKIGLLVKMVNDFTELRKRYKILKKEHLADPDYKMYELRELAVKKILTSLYGIFGYKGFRLFDNRIANSITSAGRQLLMFMKDFAEKNGNIVLSSDTDSIFMKNSNNKTLEDADKYFEEFVIRINKSLRAFVSKYTTSREYINNHFLYLEYETLFLKLIIAPSKKKYLGMAIKTKGRMLDKPELFGKGNELVKKDIPDFIKTEIRDLVLDILTDENNNIDNIVKKLKHRIIEIKKRIFEANFSELLIWKEINKDFDSYKIPPQTVRGAKNSNKFLGTDYSRQNYKGGVLHVAPNSDGIEVFFLNQYDKFNESKYKVDYIKYYEKYVLNKIALIFGDVIYNRVTQKNKQISDFLEYDQLNFYDVNK